MKVCPPDLQAAMDRSLRAIRLPRPAKLARMPFKMLFPLALQTARMSRPLRASTFWGEAMEVLLPELLSNTVYRYGIYEPDLSACLLEYLRPGMTFVDVGAHFGYFTLLAAHLVGGEGQVHSFEPTRRTFEVLQRNAAHRANVHLNNIAVSSSAGAVRIRDYGPLHSAFNSMFQPRMSIEKRSGLPHAEYDVPAVSLDAYTAEHRITPHFVKVDAESAESLVLEGMERVIRECRPIISIEVGDLGIEGVPPCRQILSRMRGAGYELLQCRGGRIEEHQLLDHYDFENLLMVPQRGDVPAGCRPAS